MSKQANRAVIGAFVIGALVLIIAAVIVFGSGKFLKTTHPFVMYFEGSVNGLDVGSSVDFRGVKIGTVTDIILRAEPKDATLDIAVYAEIEAESFQKVGDTAKDYVAETAIKRLVQRGLRAQLNMQSLVTGKLIIELDFHKDKPAVYHNIDPRYPEIPTIPSDLAELAQRIEKVPIEGILNKLHSAVSGIENVANSPETTKAIASFNQTLTAAQNLFGHLDQQVAPLASDMKGTMQDMRELVKNLDGHVTLLASSLKNTADRADAAVAQFTQTLKSLDGSVGEDSITVYELTTALNDLSDAARSVRGLADYLNRHPESLLRGKGGSQ